MIKNQTKIFIAIVISLIIIFIYYKSTDPAFYSSEVIAFDGERYNVQSDFKNKKQAADLIAKLNKRILKILAYLKQKYNINTIGDYTANEISNDSHDGANNRKITPMSNKNEQLRAIIRRLLTNYNPEVITENNPKMSSDTSFTISKQKLYLCLRSKDNTNELHDIDVLIFVTLHELAHMSTTTYGHNDEFWSVFKFLLHEASLSGYYKPIDYRVNSKPYCGLLISYSPLFDDSLPNIWQ